MSSIRHLTGIPDHIDAVAIGASAGGVEALGILLPSLPKSFRPAVFVVLHIVPHRDSLLTHIFRERCVLPVSEAGDKEPIEGGHIYFAPPDYHLQVEQDRTWSLSMDEQVNFSRPSIDVLFESAAWTYGKGLLGILLTGANSDGADGMAAIMAAGGHTWAQEPSTALSDVMPLSAISRGAAGEVLTLAQMAKRLGAPHDDDGARSGNAR